MKVKPAKLNWKDAGRVAVFVDAANVIYSLRDLGWRIDYKRLQSFFAKNCCLVDIYFYIAFFDNQKNLKSLLEMMSRKGFIVRSKAVKEIKTPDNILHKANCDVELAMDVMTSQTEFDTAVLMSGDSDFVPLIKFLQAKGKKVIIVSTRGHVAKEIINAADKFYHFDLFRPDWELKSKNPAKRGSR